MLFFNFNVIILMFDSVTVRLRFTSKSNVPVIQFLCSGNFIANLKQTLGNNVIRMNYLGDWGMQFGEYFIPNQLFSGLVGI